MSKKSHKSKKKKKKQVLKTDITKEAEQEIENRIAEMEKPDYQAPEKFSRKDYILTFAAAIICLLTLIAGAFL